MIAPGNAIIEEQRQLQQYIRRRMASGAPQEAVLMAISAFRHPVAPNGEHRPLEALTASDMED